MFVVGLPLCPGSEDPRGGFRQGTSTDVNYGRIARDGFQRLDFVDEDGLETVATAAPLTIEGVQIAALVLTKPRAEVSSAWSEVVPRLLIATLAGFVPALLLTLLLTSRFTRPLRAMETATQRVADGDLTASVDPPTTIELNHLANSFNAMVRELRDREVASRLFLMKITHDLRTPLTAIRGHAAALSDGVVPEAAVPTSLAAIESEASRLEEMVADLLDLARLDAQRFRLDMAEVDPVEHLEQAFTAHSAEAAQREITYSREIGTLPSITTDPSRLRQIVGNLIDNALRWTSTGGEVTVTAASAPHGGIRVQVCDSGPGVPQLEREVVFEPFRSSETPDGRTGSGLGLAICRQLARAMGGDVRVDDGPSGGARFTLTLPRGQRVRVAGRGPISPPDPSIH
jgi:two-component system, OmpR family, sensor kinase